MSYSHWTHAVCLALLLALPAVSRGDEPQVVPRAGVLVLRSGRVLRGDILQIGDRYVVAQGKNDEVGISVDRVEMRCDSLEDAYAHKREELSATPKVADHLALADWCLRYDLMAAAAEQLMAAQRCAPDDPANARFEKRLRLAARHLPTTSAAAAPATSGSAAMTIKRPTLPSSTGSSIASSTAVTSAAAANDLDDLMQNLPAGTIEQFTNSVQPLLINRCGAGGCHGSSGTAEFHVMYPHKSRSLPRRFTQQNLQAALKQVDRDQPDRSPLLVMATQPHGGAKAPPISSEDIRQLHHLADWVFRSLNRSQSPARLNTADAQPLPTGRSDTAASSLPGASSSSVGSDRVAHRRDQAVQQASHMQPISETARRDPAWNAPSTETPSADASSKGTDPFDPEVFNRRYLKRSR